MMVGLVIDDIESDIKCQCKSGKKGGLDKNMCDEEGRRYNVML